MENIKESTLMLKKDLSDFHNMFMQRFDNLIYWIVGTGIGTVVLFFILMKLFLIK